MNDLHIVVQFHFILFSFYFQNHFYLFVDRISKILFHYFVLRARFNREKNDFISFIDLNKMNTWVLSVLFSRSI
jgi:hypothetical protein